MKYKYLFFILFILLLLFIVLFFYDKYKKKYVVIFGSVSKDISDDINLQKDLKYLASNLNTTKYNYILPNTKKGPIGYLLNNVY